MFECAVVPDDIKKEQSVSYDGKEIITMSMSRASAFELVRQALAACVGLGGKDDSNFYVQYIVEYVDDTKKSGETLEGAKLRHLKEMLEAWMSIELTTPTSVAGQLFYSNPAYGDDAGHDVLSFAIAASALSVGPAPIIAVIAGPSWPFQRPTARGPTLTPKSRAAQRVHF